jgi:bifunctional non-homologous end joining protein LigD
VRGRPGHAACNSKPAGCPGSLAAISSSLRLPRALQLATLVDEPPEGPEWLHEQKFDGYRILAVIDDGDVRLESRRFRDWTIEFPAVARALAELPVQRALLDGEVAVVLPDGRTTFQGLQNSFGDPRANLVYFAFDLLALDDEDLSHLPLEERKHRLERLLAGGAPSILRYSDHVIGNGAAFFRLACERGLEGIVSKRRDKPYLPGRTLAWRKTKCIQRQEFVIGGFTEPEGDRRGIGALLIGYHDAHEVLVYAGKVGTGFTHAMLVELRRLLEPLLRLTTPFKPEPARAWTGLARHWVEPELVCEVAFSEWTADGRLRHPSFQGLRGDKPPREVKREVPRRSRGDGSR